MTQVWFITGVSSGLGLEIALKALESGFKVVGTVRNRQRAEKEVKQIEDQGGKCLELDVTDQKACFDVFHQAEQIYGQINVLVNNAGFSSLGPIEDFT
jgi:NADP-dependent 3-hydroxy acid dehydrogenase YdfG